MSHDDSRLLLATSNRVAATMVAWQAPQSALAVNWPVQEVSYRCRHCVGHRMRSPSCRYCHSARRDIHAESESNRKRAVQLKDMKVI